MPLSDIPEYVQQAFVAAEDKRFYQHKGIDERGLIRAFITNIAEPGRPQGGSTITQQVAKNLLVGDDVSYERKMREMIVASRLDTALSKDEILEVYLNSIYLGRGAWGIDMAARSYFKKPASALTVTEGAMLAAHGQGPAPISARTAIRSARGERFAYVLKRMQEDKVDQRRAKPPAHGRRASCLTRSRGAKSGFHFRRSSAARGASTLVGMQSLTVGILHGALDHQSQAAARHRGCACRKASRATRRGHAASSSRARRSISARACIASTPISAPRRSGAAASEAGLADRAAERAAAALRRAVAGRRSWSRGEPASKAS